MRYYIKSPKGIPKPPKPHSGAKRARKQTQEGLAARTCQQGIRMKKVDSSIVKYVEGYNPKGKEEYGIRLILLEV